MEERVYLEWVMYRGKLHHISEFVNYQNRPDVCCPLCKAKVIMRFGKINRWHVAHLPGRPCVGEDKDTATKYNIKFHIFRELERFKKNNGVTLKGTRFCKTSLLDPDYEKLRQLFGNTYCDFSQTFDIVTNWDDVLLDQTEKLKSHTIGSLRLVSG